MFTRLVIAGLLAALSVVPALARDARAHPAPDVLKTAAAAGRFDTLVSLLVVADLAEALKGDGPFVVFAPTDDAFAKLPKGAVEALRKPENKAALQAVLKLHVVPGVREVDYHNAKPRTAVTLSGEAVAIRAAGERFSVNGATVLDRNVRCGNGSIQVIDAVLRPVEKKAPIPAVAEKAGTFKTLLAALTAADLTAVLNGDGPFTVFAPTDEAFAKLPKGTVERLLKPENRGELASLLTYHVVPGKVTARQAAAAGTAKTLQGGSVTVDIADGRLTINRSTAVKTDVPADNGLIHVIDRVLMPGR